MKWNFCPSCGHRIYQHGDQGCQHVDVEENLVDCDNPDCHPDMLAVTPAHEHRTRTSTPCDCTVSHPLLVHR